VLSQDWQTSPRRYRIRHERIEIPVRAGFTLKADLFRPDADEKFPVILGMHPYAQADQLAPLMPIGQGGLRGHIEAGDYNFYVRRGYVHIIANLRGTGGSGGSYDHLGRGTIQDIYDAIEWLARQSWCSGKVGMLGLSYFSMVQKRVAALAPPHLAALFCPFGCTDLYRDWHYHGGILAYTHPQRWIDKIDQAVIESRLPALLGERLYAERLAAARADAELTAIPYVAGMLRNPEAGRNPLAAELVLNPLFSDYWQERSLPLDAAPTVPAYLGSCWGVYGLHLPGDVRSWEIFQGPKKLSIGPPIYLDRPFYQYQYESLRWFDHWLKGNDTGLMEEPPVQLFIDGTGEWKASADWPVPGTRWTPFYLHEKGLLSEHEFWPNESPSTFTDSPFAREQLIFRTPPFVEATEICGPIALTLHAATTGTELLWFVSLLEVDADGTERLLTRGWLRGTQRRLDAARSKPWQPSHAHDRRETLTPGAITEYQIEIRPYAILMKPGTRLALRLKCVDDETPSHHLHGIATGHLWSQDSTRITVFHDAEHPSHLLLPITRGNRIGTFMSGGII
jgi:predicted acyl esterase